MASSVPPLSPSPLSPFLGPTTCMECASAILNNVVARWVHSGVASQPGGGSAAYRVRLRRLLLVAREQAAGPLPPDRPTYKLAVAQQKQTEPLCALFSLADRKDGPRNPACLWLLQVWNPRISHAVLGSVQTRAAMVQRIAQTMRAFRMHL